MGNILFGQPLYSRIMRNSITTMRNILIINYFLKVIFIQTILLPIRGIRGIRLYII